MKITGTILLLFCSIVLLGQTEDGSYKKRKITDADIELLYSFYHQEGDHSAVTGGIGTELLNVHAQQVDVKLRKDTAAYFIINAGIDVITSASTDKIDFEVSSASRTDTHSKLSVGYGNTRLNNLELGTSLQLSLESDYFSRGLSLWYGYTAPDKNSSYHVVLNTYWDDLRWGRITEGAGFLKPIELVYPEELSDIKWFDEYNRYTYEFTASTNQVINRRMRIILYAGMVYQHGLLSTTFHRVYFDDNQTVRVEMLPGERIKIPVSAQYNVFLGANIILRTYYRYYFDSFGIHSHTFNWELPVKFTPLISAYPIIRYYHQTEATYFNPYGEHDISQNYYTSDYDLSAFNSLKIGFGFRYDLSVQSKPGIFALNEIHTRLVCYFRSDGLRALLFSTFQKF